MRFFLFLILADSLIAAPSLLDSVSNNVSPRTVELPVEQVELDRAILFACELDRTNWIAHLLKHGANPNASRSAGPWGTRPLQIACNRTSKEAVRLLVEGGATSYGWSPVHVATALNRTNELATLIANGADLNQKDSSGATPEHYAFIFRNTDALALLITGGAKHSYRPLQLAVILDNVEKVTDMSSDIRAVNGRDGVVDYTPLMLAAIFDRPEVCRILIKNGAELEAQAPSRGTALMLAVQNGSKNSLQELLRAGADPNHVMSGRYSPLIYAVWKSDLSAAKMLLDAGANPDLSPAEGLSARDFAKQSNSPDVQNLFGHK